jgi:hypothetical protein
MMETVKIKYAYKTYDAVPIDGGFLLPGVGMIRVQGGRVPPRPFEAYRNVRRYRKERAAL